MPSEEFFVPPLFALPPIDLDRPLGPQCIAQAELAHSAGVPLWFYRTGSPWVDLTTLSPAEIESLFDPSPDLPSQTEPPRDESRPAGQE